MKAKAALVGARGALLVAVGGQQRGVDVDDQRPGRLRAERERPGASRRARDGDHVEQAVLADAVDDTPRRRVGGHRPEQALLIALRLQIAQRASAVSEHHRQIARHAAGIVRAAALAQPRQPG